MTTQPPAAPTSKALAAVKVSRVIKAPRARVFKAWKDPEVFAQWWLNDKDEPPMALALDARKGGKYCIVQTCEACGEDYKAPRDYRWVIDGEFFEFVEPERIAFTWRVNDPGAQPTDQRVTVTFEEHPEGTLVSITHTGIVAAHDHKGTTEGWTGMLASQAKVLE
ncbi:MAG: SRPBCC family protein [Phycisphaerales bacterium]